MHGIWIRADNAFEKSGVARRIDAQDTYAKTLLELGGDGRRPKLKYEVSVSQDGEYLVRVACSSGNALRSFELYVDGGKAETESYPCTDLTLGMTRLPYSTHGLSWRPGWKVHLAKGQRCLELKWPDGKPAPSLIVDAICVQRGSNSRSN